MITPPARFLPFDLGLNPLTASRQQRGCLLTRKQWKTLRDWAWKVPTSVVGSAGELARLLLSGLLKQKRGS